jgi:hypothetical protein
VNDLLDDIVLSTDPTRQSIVLVAFPAVELEELGFRMQLSPEVAIVELMRERIGRSSPNGAHGAFTHVCASCGREFSSNRRPLPGKRSWCGRAECKKVAATERARNYRDRKAKEGRTDGAK